MRSISTSRSDRTERSRCIRRARESTPRSPLPQPDGFRHSEGSHMSVRVYGCNHIAIEVDDVDKAVAFYQDVFNLEKLDGGEGDAFFKLGEHQFLAIFERKKTE